MQSRLSRPQHLPFLDWLKAAGLALIVFGHVATRSGEHAVPPIFQKQLGVAFFVFATGFTLAGERRSPWRVVYNRLFEIVAVGLGFAVVMSMVGLVLHGNPTASNYLPFAFGANAAFNFFPANPTTWYIGTYIHILVLWAVALRRLRITGPILAGGLAIEWAIRVLLIQEAGRFTAYMFVGNWLTCLLLGLWAGQRSLATADGNAESRRFAPAVAGAAALTVGWWALMALVPWKHAFPFMSLGDDGWAASAIVSLAISFVYASYTIAAWLVARTLPAARPIERLAHNTVFVVVVHMPVYYWLHWLLTPYLGYGARTTIEFVVCLFVLTLASEAVMPRLDLRRRREVIAAAIERQIAARRAGSGYLVPRDSVQQP